MRFIRFTNAGISRLMSFFLLFTVAGSFLLPVSFADTKYRRIYDERTHQYVFVPVSNSRAKLKHDVKRVVKNPIVKQAAIGAAVGGAAGLLSDSSTILRGLGIGALVGTGTGFIDESSTLEDKPLVRTALKGAAIGTGAGAIAKRGVVKGAAIGAAAGTGFHFLRDYFKSDNERYEENNWW